MSANSSSDLESVVQPSLVYPSLQKTRPILNKYHHSTRDELNSINSSLLDQETTTKELQACIHFASRLIKLRSELRSPSYMRTSSTYTNNEPSSPISQVGRVHSLPNVSQFVQEEEEHPYSHLFAEQQRDDESEIISTITTAKDEASQLTYLTELIRRRHHKQQQSPLLNLPPKYQYNNNKLSNITPNISLNKRSLSLHDMIHQVVDEAINTSIMKRERFSSLALASQLIYASTTEQQEKEMTSKESTSKFLSSIKKEHHTTTYVTPANKIILEPSQSRDTNKSLFSTLSSDSEEEIKRSAALLVSISPSSAAAASVAKLRRHNKQTRTKLTQVYSSLR